MQSADAHVHIQGLSSHGTVGHIYGVWQGSLGDIEADRKLADEEPGQHRLSSRRDGPASRSWRAEEGKKT